MIHSTARKYQPRRCYVRTRPRRRGRPRRAPRPVGEPGAWCVVPDAAAFTRLPVAAIHRLVARRLVRSRAILGVLHVGYSDVVAYRRPFE
jgi:hypothetical protein